MIDVDAGALFCNQCFDKNNGDGIAAESDLARLFDREIVARLRPAFAIDPYYRALDDRLVHNRVPVLSAMRPSRVAFRARKATRSTRHRATNAGFRRDAYVR